MKRRPLPLNALRAFEVAGRLESFTKASHELNVTQGAVSRQVQHLEEVLGRKLFERQHRSLKLTRAGRNLLVGLTPAFDAIEHAVARVEDRADDTQLSVLAPLTFSMRWIVPRLGRFQMEHPDLQVQLGTYNDDKAPVDFNEVDIAVRFADTQDEQLVHEFLTGERLLPVCHPDLAKKLKTPEDLAGVTLLHCSAQREDWRIWLSGTGIKGVDADRGPVFATLDMAMEAAASGFGVVISDPAMIGEYVVTNRLTVPFDLPVDSPYAYSLCYPEGRLERRKVRAFRNWLMGEIKIETERRKLAQKAPGPS
ncbi:MULTISPECIES: LysR substrate-binding domain-containing protein [Thalassospira]|jgi:LysR family glycine cleavage system transcriptional activator|uniref:LysR family transcriptional regulator n=1 Tax=Thalassospira povalilytica TaxID=732237 RepID=A0A8I1M5W8_9PROT|nr:MULTISPECIES: LysR substrate-binding domain-containing protein [Thalassospira]MEE3047542.1 LysR substrate-binding domain-containing protein [Pseudomonadota bacterium]RCK27848.1 LysR family transcriptional regulator [Thalassospira profundimaris]MAL38456.1 LysR family transcriptional regulator [Thalassospira sp.]MBN8195531.1 LysR family transcriptional regulator [Thalassospira povalilytica]MBO6770134.1 LysR family transcriptional regulator [Thalassospira sp.]